MVACGCHYRHATVAGVAVLQPHLELHARGQKDACCAAGGGAHDISRQLPQVQLLQQAAQSDHQLRAVQRTLEQPNRARTS